jgi:hypothetical protein
LFVDLDRPQPCPSCRGLIIHDVGRNWLLAIGTLIPIGGMLLASCVFPPFILVLVPLALAWVGLCVLGFPYFECVRAHGPTCVACGYDLRGLPLGGRCPECGEPGTRE